GGFDQRPASDRDSSSPSSTVATAGKSALAATALPRTTRDLAAPAAPTPLGQLRVTADRLNVRRSPQISADNVLGGLDRGAVITPPAREGEWVRIEFHGMPAFIHGSYVEPVTRPTASGAPLMTHVEATTTSAEHLEEHHAPQVTPAAGTHAPATP